MAFEKQLPFTKKVADLPDVPQMSSAELKNYFDSSTEELRVTFNKLIDVLTSEEDAKSGADNIKMTKIGSDAPNNVQWYLEFLKARVDEKTVKTGDHAGTWQGYDTRTLPLAVTRDQMFIIPEADTIYNGQSGERYPLGTSIMTVSGSQWAFPAAYGMVVTHKFSDVRMTQWFHRTVGALEAWYRYWSVNDGYGPWQKVATEDSVNTAIGAVVKGTKIQSGTISFSLAASTNTSKTVSFPEAFSTGPAVTISVRNSSNPENFGDITVNNVSSTGFTLVGRNNTQSAVTVAYSWIAMV